MTTVTLASLTGCAGVVATTYALGTTEQTGLTSDKVNCCGNTCCSTNTAATDACCNPVAKAAKATAGTTNTAAVVVQAYSGSVTFPFPNCGE